MIFSTVFILGHLIWKKLRIRKLNFTCITLPNIRNPCIKLGEFNIINDFIDALADCEDFKIHSNDVWICTFSKSGTTWMQEMVYLLVNDVDFEKAKSAPLDVRSPFFETEWPGRSVIADYPTPRVIKTHMPYQFLPPGIREGKCKVIYVMRNPKDVAVSFHYHMKSLAHLMYDGDVSDCCRMICNGTTPNFGPYAKHLQQYWEQRHRDNVLIMKYEDMQEDLASYVRKVANFLGKRVTDEQVAQIAKWCSFSEMKSNSAANYSWRKTTDQPKMKLTTDFMRKGIIGDWKNHFSPEMSSMMDAFYERELKPLGIEFQFE